MPSGAKGQKSRYHRGQRGLSLSHLKREEAPARVHRGGHERDRLVVEKAAVGVRGSGRVDLGGKWECEKGSLSDFTGFVNVVYACMDMSRVGRWRRGDTLAAF